MNVVCAVCGKSLTDYDGWVYHSRLNVTLCLTCPRTDVHGEDITNHSMIWNPGGCPCLTK